jgi:hypothetical protein
MLKNFSNSHKIAASKNISEVVAAFLIGQGVRARRDYL